ncbi:MAG: hypothetical protein ACW98D_20620 [Promethearchaeota archaeon]|jgi:hypothetical protein
MIKNILIILFITAISSFSTEFTFSSDTIWENEPYSDSGFTVVSYLINLSDDSLYIDSLDLIVDSITFQKYEITWLAKRGVFAHVYSFGNWGVTGYGHISKYNKEHLLMRTAPKDSLQLKSFIVDRKISPIHSLDLSKTDSIVQITMSLIFFSGNNKDTLIFKGLYNYDTPVSIQKSDIKIKLYNDFRNQQSFIYNCLGRRIAIKNISNKQKKVANGIYTNFNKKQVMFKK